MSDPKALELLREELNTADHTIRELRLELARVRDREGTMVGFVAGSVCCVPFAYFVGKAVGLAQRPTVRERFGSWLMDAGFRLLA